MSEARSLFAMPAPAAPPATARAPVRLPAADHQFRRLAKPSGMPDKRGKYPYEKFHAAASAIDERARVKFFDLLQVTDATMFSHIIEIGVLWNRLSVRDQMDYEDAIRLRG